jgi:hypothetical protein
LPAWDPASISWTCWRPYTHLRIAVDVTQSARQALHASSRVALLGVRRHKIDTSIWKDKRKAALNQVRTRVLAEHVGGLTKPDLFQVTQRDRSDTWCTTVQYKTPRKGSATSGEVSPPLPRHCKLAQSCEMKNARSSALPLRPYLQTGGRGGGGGEGQRVKKGNGGVGDEAVCT